MEFNGAALFITAFIAVLAPLISEIPIGLRLPMVVVEVGLGIVVGPHVLGWASPTGMLGMLGYLGLIFLFFLCGMELDFEAIRGKPLKLAVTGWGLSVVVAFALSALLYWTHFIQAPLLIAVALTTTGMGTLMPILRDSGELGTRFGTYVVAAGAVGEFGPIVLLSVLLTREHTRWIQTALMLFFVLLALLAAGIALLPKTPRIVSFFADTMNSTSQLPVRIAILVLALLIAIAEKFGLDMILGAFTAGMIVSLGSKGIEGTKLVHRLEAIGYGFLIPMFFVASGMHFDIHALAASPRALWRLPLFLLLMFVARSVPIVFYRYELAKEDRIPFVFYSATSLPLLIAIGEIGVQTGRMMPDNAAAIVGAGMLSILLFPITALLSRRYAAVPTPIATRAQE
ncbi:MAG: cation:proton antiporter [Terriglobales bacterium]|jgi:Kef-type K+ transport system membrane component KefB